MKPSESDNQGGARSLAGLGMAVVVCLWAFGVAGQEDDGEATEPDAPESSVALDEEETPYRLTLPDWVSGTLDIGLDAAMDSPRRDGNGSNDIKFDQLLRLRIEPPKHEKMRVRTSLWMIEDLDGTEPTTSSFRSINDASRAAVEARLLSLYLEVDDVWGDSTLRLGRQRILEGVVYNRMDGAYFKQLRGNWDWYAFGGARASLYEDAHEDTSAGAGASVRLPTRTRVSLDYFYGEDDRRGPSDVDADLISLTLRQQLGPYHSLFGRSTWHDGKLDEVQLSATGIFIAPEIVYSVAYRKRESVLIDRPVDINEFVHVLGELNEFDDLLATLDVPVTEKMTVTLEGQLHDADEATLNTGNRDYNRFAAILSGDEVAKGVDFSVVLEHWDADSAENAIIITGEVSKQWEKVKLTGGADYERFQDRITTYDALTQSVENVTTHENIHSVFGRMNYTINEDRSVWFKVIYEKDDTSNSPYWRFRGVYSIRF